MIAGIVDTNSGINDVPFFDTGDLGFAWRHQVSGTTTEMPTYAATVAASGLTMDPYGPNSNPNTDGTFQNCLDTWSVE